MRTLQRDFVHTVAQDWIAAEHVPFNPSYYCSPRLSVKCATTSTATASLRFRRR